MKNDIDDRAETRRNVQHLLRKPMASLGYGNLARSTAVALAAAAGRRSQVARHLLPRLWRGLGDRKAVVCHDGFTTFEEQADRALRLADSLHRLGLRPNDRVGALLRNEQAWFDTMLATMLMGMKMPLLNTHLSAGELTQCINGCAPKVLIFSRDLLSVVRQVEPHLKSVTLFICAGRGGELPDGYVALEDLMRSSVPVLPPGGFGVPHMPFSGGSTGVPKFITESGKGGAARERMKGMKKGDMRALQRQLVRGLSRLGIWSIPETIVALVPGPVYHAGPQIAVLTLLFGSTVVPMYRFDPEEFLSLIERERVNYTFVAPTMLERVLKLPESVLRKYDLSSMRVVLCAAAPCPEKVKRDTNALFKRQGAPGEVFHEYYGSSEATLITVLCPDDYREAPERYKSVGRPAGSECRVYDPERERWCAAGEVGHVVVRNARMYRVAYGGTDEMDRAFRLIDGVYWYDDGCLGFLSEDGFLYLTSRSKDMIICGGVNIFPAEIEDALKSHPLILDAAVVKVADADLGEVPGALIQVAEGGVLDEAAVLAHCKAQGLYGFKLPRAIRFTTRVLKTPAGKVRKQELEAEFLQTAG